MLRVPAAVLAAALLAGLSGCAADGTSNGNVAVRPEGLPFSFEVPADFTHATVDEANTRGSVVALRALDKVDVVAVRRLAPGARRTETRLTVLGKDVVSRVTPVGHGFGIECQFTPRRRAAVLKACATALRTLRFT
jgi:hypothetical protein